MSRGMRIALIASLAVNIFLVGAIASGVYRWRQTVGIGLSQGWRARAIRVLPDDEALRFRREMRATVLTARPVVRIAQQSRRNAADLFVAPDFDAAAVSAQFRRARAGDFILRERVEAKLVDFAASLPQDERRQLARALRRGPLRQPARGAE